MKISVTVGHINGDEAAMLTTDKVKRAIEFLKKEDHEGSDIGINIESDNHEEVYLLLQHLVTLPKRD